MLITMLDWIKLLGGAAPDVGRNGGAKAIRINSCIIHLTSISKPSNLFYLDTAGGNNGQLFPAICNLEIQFNYNLKSNIYILQSKLRNGSY